MVVAAAGDVSVVADPRHDDPVVTDEDDKAADFEEVARYFGVVREAREEAGAIKVRARGVGGIETEPGCEGEAFEWEEELTVAEKAA